MLLSPSQQAALDWLKRGLAARPLAILRGISGLGMSTVLRAFADEAGATYLSARDFAPAIGNAHPLAFEDRAIEVISQHIAPGGSVVVDDLHLVLGPAQHYSAPRFHFVNLPLAALCEQAESQDCKLIRRSLLPAFVHSTSGIRCDDSAIRRS